MFIWTFFDHKDLGNHLLQLCPKVVKHPVYLSLSLGISESEMKFFWINFRINLTKMCHRNQGFMFMIHIHIIHEKFKVNRDDPKKNSALTEIKHKNNWRDMPSRSICFKPGVFGMRTWNYKKAKSVHHISWGLRGVVYRGLHAFRASTQNARALKIPRSFDLPTGSAPGTRWSEYKWRVFVTEHLLSFHP